MKIFVGIVVLHILVGAGAYIYIIRPPVAPSENVQIGTELQVPSVNEQVMSGIALFRISQEKSHVEFNIDEVLRGEDFTVVGITNQVAGDIRFNFNDPTQSEVGAIRVNARTLKTDSVNRNAAINNIILKSS
jgi:polyisoprenoid-binding protein YceI